MKNKNLAIAIGIAGMFSVGVASASTLDTVRERGTLICGVNVGLAGFSAPNDAGEWSGFDVDFCRAVAVAVLGDATKVSFVPLTSAERFTALQAGEIDVLSRNSTWTLSRDTTLGLNFAGVMYYDGQGFMVRQDMPVTSAKDLDGASVCVQTGTTTELNLADYFRSNGMQFEPVVFDSPQNSATAFEAGRCDVITDDTSGLYATRLRFTDPGAFKVLPEVISKEPLAPVVRHADDAWFDVISWVRNALITAEELGITSANVDEKLASEDPNVKRLLGTDGDMGMALGLQNDWAYQVIKAMGNYGEVFERNLGESSPMKVDRGLNNLWNNGGIQYAPPMR